MHAPGVALRDVTVVGSSSETFAIDFPVAAASE